MRWTVGVLGLLAAVGGFLQFAPVWHPFSDWIAPVAAPIAEATNGQEAIGSIWAVLLGLAGIGIAWLIYGAKSVEAPAPVRALEKKFYWDELYNWLWYYPSDLIARGLAAFVERPLIAGSLAFVGEGFGLGSRELGRAQNGLVRTYALALAGSVAILVVVFLSVR
jgi:NADH-quinone oxidoreductase subunit L